MGKSLIFLTVIHIPSMKNFLFAILQYMSKRDKLFTARYLVICDYKTVEDTNNNMTWIEDTETM